MQGGDLFIRRSYLHIDGASAAYPGITIDNIGKLKFEPAGPPSDRPPVHDIIVNDIRAIGSGGRMTFVPANDLWELDGSSNADVPGYSGPNVYNIVLDHNTTEGAGNGNFEIYGWVENVSVTRNAIFWSVQGQHVSTNDIDHVRSRITYYGNVYAEVSYRHPRVRYNVRQLEYIGNVIYGWGQHTDPQYGCDSSGIEVNIDSRFPDASGNIESNIYIHVPDDGTWPGYCAQPSHAIGTEFQISGSWYTENNTWPVDALASGSFMSRLNAMKTVGTPVDMEGYEVPRSVPDINSAGMMHPTLEESAKLAEITAAAGL